MTIVESSQGPRSIILDGDISEGFRRIERIQEEARVNSERNRDSITKLEARYTAFEQGLAAAVAAIQGLSAKFDEFRRPNMALYAILIGALPVCGTIMAFYFSSLIGPVTTEIQSQKSMLERQTQLGYGRDQEIGKLTQTTTTNSALLASLAQQVQTLSERTLSSIQADANSKADRDQLNKRISAQEHDSSAETAQRRAQMAAVNVHIGEIEQQFHSVSNITNKDRAEQMRINALLWERAFPGTRWPDYTFFPTSIFQGSNGSSPIADGVTNDK